MTFCIAINTEIVVSTCPLRKDACYWQHRTTQQCRYTTKDMTVEEFCTHVGIDTVPTPDELKVKVELLKEELQA